LRVGVIGLGLIGGSVALAARERLGAHVTGFDASPEARERALARGAVDAIAPDVAGAVADADVVWVATPVGALPAAVAASLDAAGSATVVTDVGSTKRRIVAAVEDQRFVGGHPLAGAETAGIDNARADLFAGATWYLTPTERTSGILFERLHRAIVGLGAQPAAIDAAQHDAVLAAVSHLPHVVANVLVSGAAQALAAEDVRVPAAGPSFRDATRVAGASNAIWRDIYLANADALIDRIDDAIARLRDVRVALAAADGDRIAAWNDAAAGDRRALLEAQLAGGELHELRVSVPNEPGVIARIALALGRAGVNITDMALYPTADATSGLVALWIAGAEPAARAQELLGELGHPVARA
jgi:prephenate dehydrogenase